MHGNLRKTVIGSAVSAVLLVGLLSVPVLAAEKKEEYEIWVQGIRITSENKDNVFGNDENNANKVKYDPDTNTLSFDGARLVDYFENGLIYSMEDELTISGKVTILNDHAYTSGIYSSSDLTIKDADITVLRADNAIGAAGDLNIIDSKIRMKEIGKDGIKAWNDITVSGKKTDIYVEAGESSVTGSNIIIKDGSKLTLSANDEAIFGHTLEINNSTIKVDHSKCGLYAQTVLISGKDSIVDLKSQIRGIEAMLVTISGGKTTIDATLDISEDQKDFICGISATDTLCISYPDTVVEVKGKDSGISAADYLKIENSRVKASGELNGIYSGGDFFIIGKKAEVVADCKKTENNIGSAIIGCNCLTIQGDLMIKCPENGSTKQNSQGERFIVTSDGNTTAPHIVINAHKLTYVPASEPTLDKDGNKEYYKCDDCDDIFADPAGETRLDKDSVIIPKLQPSATPTPVATATPTAAPTATPIATPTSVAVPTTAAPTATTAPATPTPTTAPADSKAQIMDFVKRIYIYVLDREPEEEGAAFWSDELWNFRRTGAEVAQGFIFSAEFEARNTTDEQFVEILYKTFFGRDPEEEGMAFWLNQLKTGAMDRVTVANGFIYSQEWADTCAEYGIRSGGDIKPTGNIKPTELTYAFVERMYTTAMGRGYDEEGRQYWASELANFNITGEQVGAFFFLSDEMVNYNLSNKDYLDRLYKTFMDREPDADGAAYWLGVLESGTSRTDVVLGFTRSPEFTQKCVEARILPY